MALYFLFQILGYTAQSLFFMSVMINTFLLVLLTWNAFFIGKKEEEKKKQIQSRCENTSKDRVLYFNWLCPFYWCGFGVALCRTLSWLSCCMADITFQNVNSMWSLSAVDQLFFLGFCKRNKPQQPCYNATNHLSIMENWNCCNKKTLSGFSCLVLIFCCLHLCKI